MASSMEEDEDEFLIEDYYSFFNVDKKATSEEITNAYRRLSKLYHPDKHEDMAKKKEAEILFNKTRKAYDVLNDPHKRAIYDTLGLKGLEAEGWEIVQRTKTPQEIREEYEQLAREREERRLQQRTNPKGTILIGIDATDIFDRYDDDVSSSYFPRIEINNMSISQSIEAPLTITDTASLSGSLSTHNGTGSGSISWAMRRLFGPKGWSELEFTAGNGLVCTLKGFRTLTKRSFLNMAGIFQSTPHGIRPGFQTTIAHQLDKHTVGYLTWKAGIQSSMTSSLVWDSETGHLVMALQFGIPNTFVMFSYTHKFPEEARLKGSLKFGTFGALMEYGYEKKVSQHSHLGASVVIGIPSGVTLKVKLSRANQNYIFPILLSEQFLPSAVFYGTVAPVLIYHVVKVLVVNPIVKQQKQREAEKKKEANASKLAEKKKEAMAAVDLMTETVQRICQQEEAKKGLIIVQAWYGKLITEEEIGPNNDLVIDVTIPLQLQVKDSKLILHETSKNNLPGFYDPCIGETKSLRVRYKFHNFLHDVTVAEHESLRIPKQSHRIES